MLWPFAAVVLAACGTITYIVQQYGGEPRPNEEIAILRINGGEGPRVASLDGESLGPGISDAHTRLHIEMLPGMHVVEIEQAQGFYPTPKLRFSAQAGAVYRAVMATALVRDAKPGQGMLVPRLYEVDRDSDALIRDATWQPPRRARVPRPEPVRPGLPAELGSADAGVDEAPESRDAGVADADAAAAASDAARPPDHADSGASLGTDSGMPPSP